MQNKPKTFYPRKFDDFEFMFSDYKGLMLDVDMLAGLAEVDAYFSQDVQDVLMLVDFKGSYFTHAFLNEAKRMGRLHFDKVKFIAPFNVDSNSKVYLINTFIQFAGMSKKVKIFKTEEEAVAFLKQLA